MSSYLTNKLISIDQFGYGYEFAFNQKKGKYKTAFGGILSLIINIIIIW